MGVSYMQNFSACSHYNNSRTTESRKSNVPPQFQNFIPTDVCSFYKADNCSSRKKIGTFNQIELYDNSVLLVPRLQIIIKDYLNASDFVCINAEGKRVSTTPPYQGTSVFCENHSCSEHAEKFCIYDTPIALHDFSDATSTTFLIPIRAWGTTNREFYPHNPQNYAEAILLSPKCSKGGLDIATDRIIDAIEACIASYCIFTSHVSATSLMFPTELIVFRYTVQISGWQNGIRVHQSSITCPAHPICEVLNCILCLEKIYNSQCWTKLDILLATTSIIIIISMYWILSPMLFVIRRLVKLPLLVFKCLLAIVRKVKGNHRQKDLDSFSTPFRTYTRAKRRPRSLKNSTLLITILAFTMSGKHTHGCSDVVSITSTTESCSRINSTQTCTFNQGVVLTLQPLGQDLCLSLRNDDNEPVGLLSLRTESIFHVCQKKIEFFTRDHEFNSESSHRCYKAGSCKPNKCDNTKTSDTIAEFSWKASHHPGFTFCKASCQCLMCDGCFYCTPSCLFYRYYATPSSDTIYTVFTCPIWELTVNTEITFQLHNQEPETHHIVLRPGRTSRVKDVKLSLLATVSPQLPVLGSTFITDGKRTAMTMRVQANELTPQTPGQLQCASKMDAIQFKCRFSPRTCICSTGAFKATCTCPEGKMSNHLQHNALPFTTKNIIIEEHEDTIAARAQVGSAIHVQTNVENMKIVSVQNHGKCSIMTSTIEGCYSCLLGATVTIVCYSTSDQSTADIICDDQHQIATCTQRGKITALNFHFDSPKIDINCTISCPGGRSHFLINGTLDYVHDSALQREIAIDSDVSVNPEENVWDTATEWISSITDFFGLLKILLISFALILLLLVVLFIVTLLSRIASIVKKQS
ncbi:tenuivirus PVC2 protein [Teladorsagia circumcincta]|uniref:Envelopment polyprotein n=1 Tax=Teladorsagia circumcincta TaxID=45464 RepID=A0A2G9UII8_TELCI|nr:tenuivirus PVC2 protein [Teladorsagia circumcincta]